MPDGDQPRRRAAGPKGTNPTRGALGIGDDVDRSMAVEEAALGDLQELISRVRDTPDEVWNDWLAGSEAEGPPWPEAYQVFTCLVMAYEEARVVVTKRGA